MTPRTAPDEGPTGTERLRFDARYARLGAASAVVASVGLVALAGLPGVVAAAALVAAWVLLPASYAFALGQVALVALAPGGGLLGVAVAEAGLLGVLLAPATTLPEPGPPVALAVAWALGGVALAWASAGGTGGTAGTAGAGTVGAGVLAPWQAGFALIAVTALAAYGLHRYQLVSLGLVEADDSRTDDGSAGGGHDEQ